MPKLKHYDNTGTARFVTFSCYKKRPLLIDERAKEILISEIQKAREKYCFKIIGYVIMPNHVHLVLIPPYGMKLGTVIGEIKSRMARVYFAEKSEMVLTNRIFWQKRCYDHNCRSPKAVVEKIEYCHKNPIRAALAKDQGEYRWSSYDWYRGERNVPLEIDRFEC